MKKVIRFLIELIISIFLIIGFFSTVGFITSILENIPLLILIAGLFLLMILATILELKNESSIRN